MHRQKKERVHKGIYAINLDGSDKQSISSETGSNDAEFSTGMKFFVKSYSNANTPSVYSLCDQTGKELFVLEDNKLLKDKLSKYTTRHTRIHYSKRS